MSTNSMIGIELKSKIIKAVYCHFDGFIETTGRILIQYYQNRKKVQELVSLGDVSSIAENIGSKHNFDNPPENECNFYGRDRGETNIEAEVFNNRDAYVESSSFKYLYLFSANNKWLIYSEENEDFVELNTLI